MGYPTYPFLDYEPLEYFNLSDNPETIIETTSNNLLVDFIAIVNMSSDDIRINLKKITIKGGSPFEEGLLAYNFLVPSYRSADAKNNYHNTVNLVDAFNLRPLILKYDPTPVTGVIQKLDCYSNGAVQLFNCFVSYTIFNEIPSTPS